jgi:serine/threonine-protein kinase
MAYEMVLGRLPFLADSPIDAIDMHVHAPPPRPRILWREIPPSLEQLLLGLLAKDPAQRPTMAAVRASLNALAATVTPALGRLQAPAPRLPTVRALTIERRRRLMVAAVALAFVLLALLAYRPAQIRAQQPTPTASPPVAAAASTTPSVVPQEPAAARQEPGPTSTPISRASAPAPHSPSLSDPRGRTDPPPRRLHRRHKDANYLLDPFVK